MSNMATLHAIHGDRDYFSASTPPGLALELNNLLGLDFAQKADGEANKGEIHKKDQERADDDSPRSNGYFEQRLVDILARWPDCIDPYIALFKFYFRTADYSAAEKIVWRAMAMLCQRLPIPINYRLVRADQLNWLEQGSEQRHYLFCLKALGVIRLRRQRVHLAHVVLKKLAELDPYDEIGGGSFLQIVESALEQ